MKKIIQVDLTDKKQIVRTLPKDIFLSYFGGRGLNSKMLLDLLPNNIDPLSSENILCFAPGVLTGMPVPGACITFASSLSPLTGMLGDSKVSGRWGPALTSNQFQALVISGRAKKPLYILIENGDIKYYDAEWLWGLTTWDTEESLKKEHGDVEVVSIGPSGENLVLIACIISGKLRAFGRSGLGCIMGSKRLKAIAIRPGEKENLMVNPEATKEMASKVFRKIAELIKNKDAHYFNLSTYGTTYLVRKLYFSGRLPIKNHTTTIFPQINEILPEHLLEKYHVDKEACFMCPVGCLHCFRTETQNERLFTACGIQYEILAGFGPLMGVSNFNSISEAYVLANQFGLDATSTANAIAFAIECFKKGLLTEADTGGLKLEWGDPELAGQLIRKIVYKQDIGQLLSIGAVKASEKIGGEASTMIMHSGGLDWEASEMRAYKGGVLLHVTSTRGGDCTRAGKAIDEVCVDPRSYHGKASIVIKYENMVASVDSLGICRFLIEEDGYAFNLDDLCMFLASCYGLKMTNDDLLTLGERIYNVERLFNLRHNPKCIHVELAPRLLEPLPDGLNKGQKIDLDKFQTMLKEYYKLRGWDDGGVPSMDKIEHLRIQTDFCF